ncbi:Alpha-tocopherol transfer protein [Dissostichus eleginoides]|uniref:Alpha-tocopherol transfer protein n=1 Tax=Dissostichus eleginoides TaxID=100907 RepID=A0AAD9B7E2_DISEL|nr:Alpha-tocopherol transfer protein [Dissostichus eleginoides]
MFFRPVFAMIRPFLPDKIRKRIHMHGADFQDTLSDFFSPSVLPPEYGGEGPGDITIPPEDCWISERVEAEQLLEG